MLESLFKTKQKIIKELGLENGLVTSYSRSKILKKLGKISILIPVCSFFFYVKHLHV